MAPARRDESGVGPCIAPTRSELHQGTPKRPDVFREPLSCVSTVAVMRPATRDRLHAICSGESPEPTYLYSYVRTRSTGNGRATVVLSYSVYRGVNQLDQTTGKCMTWLCKRQRDWRGLVRQYL